MRQDFNILTQDGKIYEKIFVAGTLEECEDALKTYHDKHQDVYAELVGEYDGPIFGYTECAAAKIVANPDHQSFHWEGCHQCETCSQEREEAEQSRLNEIAAEDAAGLNDQPSIFVVGRA